VWRPRPKIYKQWDGPCRGAFTCHRELRVVLRSAQIRQRHESYALRVIFGQTEVRGKRRGTQTKTCGFLCENMGSL
ncbi:hypothetical protein ILYODFUR_024365, partial [Ilyodon furcidens]